MSKQIFFALGLLAFVFVLSCENGNSNSNYLDQADCTGVDAASNTYTNSIKEIIDNECATSGCHNSSSRRDGVDLSTYSKVKSAFENTECLCTIHHGSGCKPMPDGGGKLSEVVIQKIDCWAKNGYAE